MRDKPNIAQALQMVVDMIADTEADEKMSVRFAMLLQMVKARVDHESYCEMLKELARYVEFEKRECEMAQTVAQIRSFLSWQGG